MSPLIPIYFFLETALKLAVPVAFAAWVVSFILLARRRKATFWTSLPIASGIASLMCLFTLCGQCILPTASVMVPGNPTEEDLIGVWVPTEPALKLMKEDGYGFSTHTLEFKEDGTFVMTNIPDKWMKSTGEAERWFYSGYGTWEIVQDEDEWKVNVRFTSVTPNTIGKSLQFGWAFPLDLLYFYLSTGSDEKAASFEKCGSPRIRMSDEMMEPFLSAMDKVNRASLGFTPVPANARVEIEGTIGVTDVTLHVYADTSRTILFKTEGDSYRWVAEQEIHRGPEQWIDHDGAVWHETISVNYQIEPWNSIPVNTIVIDYTGRDPKLSHKRPFELTLQDVQPIIEEWQTWRLGQPPSPASLCP